MKPRFRVYKDLDRWVWECTFCDPPAIGGRKTWQRVIYISMPGHMRHRRCHHEGVARRRARA